MGLCLTQIQVRKTSIPNFFNILIVIYRLALYTSGRVEFYFETARTVMDLALTQTFQNFTSLKYIIPHCGGAYPSIEDRSLSTNSQLKNRTQEIYNSRYVPVITPSTHYCLYSADMLSGRFWYDSAGPTFPHQVQGLLAYGVPRTQLLYGSVSWSHDGIIARTNLDRIFHMFNRITVTVRVLLRLALLHFLRLAIEMGSLEEMLRGSFRKDRRSCGFVE